MTSSLFVMIVIVFGLEITIAKTDHQLRIPWRLQNPIESGHVVFSVDGGQRVARQLASDYNLHYVSEVFVRSNYYHAVIKRGQMSPLSHRLLFNDSRITWIERQVYRPRVLRFITDYNIDVAEADKKTADGRSSLANYPLAFNDPFYPLQWYLHGMNNGDGRHHLNVPLVWQEGLTGRGVSVLVLDDNVDSHNPEISRNYDAEISADFSALVPKKGRIKTKKPIHGTYCAAVIAAEANNSRCGVGVAFNARVGGIRLLIKKRVLDVAEANALNHRLDRVDIYSASWGPPDDGKHIGGPGVLASHALYRGVHLGRGGLGAIYIWASGNGGMKGDNCGYDSYASSIYTLTVSSLTNQGLSPNYAEACPSALTSLYVGGHHQRPMAARGGRYYGKEAEQDVVVPLMGDGCHNHFQGTSAAAPLAAGIIALLLESNPRLTWRDVQHLVVLSSAPPPPSMDAVAVPEWHANGAGLRSNVRYGFGALDAARLIERGRQWVNVPLQSSHIVQCQQYQTKRKFPPNQSVDVSIEVDSHKVNYLEYVSVSLTARIVPRGVTSVSLQSPSGFVSPLLAPRWNDNSTFGFRNWNLTTAQFWGENPNGEWLLSMINFGHQMGTIDHCSITFFGY